MFKKNFVFNVNLDNVDPKPQWYTIVTHYNYEQYVVNTLNKLIDNKVIFDSFCGIKVHEEKVINKKGEEKIKIRNEKIMPNYVFVKASMTVNTWNMLMALTGVSAILCISGVPVSTDENKIFETKKLLGKV